MARDDYYTLGRSGLRVSRLALGAMTFGRGEGWYTDEPSARSMIDCYLEAGGNFIDTADAYTGGVSEQIIGQYLRDKRNRDRIVLATKFSHNQHPGDPNAGGNHRKNIYRAVDTSLTRLQTDYIDLYLLHTWDRVTPVEEVARALDDLVRAGKLRYVGLSDVPAWYAARYQTLAELTRLENVCTLQMEYSLTERHVEYEFVPLAIELGMSIMVWSPLASGLLTGKYRRESQKSNDGRLGMMQNTGLAAFDKFTERNWQIVAELESVSRQLNRPMAQVAINWVANQPAVGSVVLGASKLNQLQDTLQSLDFDIPPELRARLNQVSAPPPQFPYTFFQGPVQRMLQGGTYLHDKPPGYYAAPHLEDPRSP
ncbi:MAG: aldo/keto reductase [Steroidobacteraceae bacterium]